MSIFNHTANSSSSPLEAWFLKEVNSYFKKVNFYLAFVQAVILIIALIGNTLALIVINRKSLRNTSSAVFITYMAIFDSAVLILHVPSLFRYRWFTFLHCALTFLRDLFTFCANWVLVIITIERFVAVSSPFLAKRFCTQHSARRSVGILVLITLIILSSTFPIFYHPDPLTARGKCRLRRKLAFEHRIYQVITMYLIPDILLTSNFFTILILFLRKREQENLSENKMNMRVTDISSNRKQRQLTIMLVTVNLAFYVFTTPAIIDYMFPSMLTAKQEPDIKKAKRKILLSQITVPLLQLNNATNFIFYCFAGQRFRRACVQTLYDCVEKLCILYHRCCLCDRDYRPAQKHPRTSSLGALKTVKRNPHFQEDIPRGMRTSTI